MSIDREFIAHIKSIGEAIDAVGEGLDPACVKQALDLLTDSTYPSAKVIVSGSGKSGDVGKKVAATFCSFGKVAFFLHPVDALHGDLGVLQEGDVLIAISYSGGNEIVNLLPHIKARRIKIIAIVGNDNSPLAEAADVLLKTPIEFERGHLNLAPTTSASLALIVGDALALFWAKSRSVTREMFAVNHPGGSLGRKLTTTVADLMHAKNRNPCASENANWIEVISTITAGGLGAVNVVDDKQQLVGFVTDGDLRRALEKTPPEDLSGLKAVDIMTRSPLVVQEKVLASEALDIMERRPLNHLPVVTEGNRCVGMICVHDIVRAGIGAR